MSRYFGVLRAFDLREIVLQLHHHHHHHHFIRPKKNSVTKTVTWTVGQDNMAAKKLH